jgi:hypothetical protein
MMNKKRTAAPISATIKAVIFVDMKGLALAGTWDKHKNGTALAKKICPFTMKAREGHGL